MIKHFYAGGALATSSNGALLHKYNMLPTRAGLLDYTAFLCQEDQLVSRELKLTESIIFKDFVIYQEISMFKSSKTFRRLQVLSDFKIYL